MTIKSLEKIIKYRLSYSSTKETDILYKKYFLNNFKKFHKNDLILLTDLFDKYTDKEIYHFLIGSEDYPIEYKNFFKKILDEKK